jgi:DNA-binding response OmpR family regulator
VDWSQPYYQAINWRYYRFMTATTLPHSVLLVEPDKLLATSYRKALGREGIAADWQQTAQGAINSIDRVKPQLILLEVQLHGHNGIEFLHELRSYTDWQKIPIVLFTLVPEHELGLTAEAKEQLSIVDYKYKPHTSLEQMVSVVKNFVGSTP